MSQTRRFYLIDALFEGGRMFVGSISVAFILSRGLAAADIATIKGLQALVVFWGEVPTGVLADRFGRKASLLTSLICAILGFSLYLTGTTLVPYLIGELFLALSLCFWSGSYESWAVEACNLEGDTKKIRNFFHTGTAINQTAVMVSGLLGGLIASANSYSTSYVLAISAMLICTLIVLKTAHRTIHHTNTHENWIGHHIRTSLAALTASRVIATSVGLLILLQFLAQPMLHYWQPYFQSLSPQVGGAELGVLFSIFCIGTAAANYGIKKAPHIPITIMVSTWILGSFLLSFKSPYWQAVGLMTLIQSTYSIMKARINAQIAESANSSQRATVLSSANFASRIGMLASLLLIHILLTSNSTASGIESYRKIFLYASGLSIAAVLSLLLLNYQFGRSKVKNALQGAIK